MKEQALPKPTENFPGALMGIGTWEAQVNLPKWVTLTQYHAENKQKMESLQCILQFPASAPQ